MMCHYSEGDLERYKNGDMFRLFRMFCYFHLRSCEKCRKKLDELTEDDFLIQDLRNHLNKELQTRDKITILKHYCFHKNRDSVI